MKGASSNAAVAEFPPERKLGDAAFFFALEHRQ
jgi:hypothetical protein